MVEAYYEVQTNVPVGDVPREADIVLLRRITERPLPFHGIWTCLTTWNILEFKSPAVTPRLQDVDLLLELGLGIERRLNEERTKQRLQPMPPAQVSWWYLANRLNRSFLERCRHRLGSLAPAGQGLWRSSLIERSLFLVSNADLPVDTESLPLHIVSQGPRETELAVVRLVLERPALRRTYAPWLAALHDAAWKEAGTMARATKELKINLEALAEFVGLDRLIAQFGLKRVVNEVGLKRVVDEVGLDAWLASLSPAQRRELKRRLR